MADYIVRGLALENNVRVFGIDSTLSCRKASKDHNCTPLASVAFGRAITAASIMGAMLKGNEKMTLQINGNGPIGTIMVVADAKGIVKGFVSNPDATADVFDVSKVVGDLGLLKVIKDNQMKQNFTGQVTLQTGQIGDDISYYFYASEQVPSIVVLAVNLDDTGKIVKAGGIIAQLMPSATEEDKRHLEELFNSYGSFSSALKEKKIEDIIKELFNDFTTLSFMDIKYRCSCSKEKFREIVKLTGKEEIKDMIAKDHGCHVRCNFCNKEYDYTEEELEEILKEIK